MYKKCNITSFFAYSFSPGTNIMISKKFAEKDWRKISITLTFLYLQHRFFAKNREEQKNIVTLTPGFFQGFFGFR
jgi:hypothetical protein